MYILLHLKDDIIALLGRLEIPLSHRLLIGRLPGDAVDQYPTTLTATWHIMTQEFDLAVTAPLLAAHFVARGLATA